jgi:hypothetical protein
MASPALLATASGNVPAGFDRVTISCNCTSGNIVQTLPDATLAANQGMEATILKSDSSANTVGWATTGGQTVNGSTTPTPLSGQYAHQTVKAINGNWNVIG